MVKVSPAFKEKLVKVVIRAAEEGISVWFHQGYRSLEYQQQLHDWWLDPVTRKMHGIVAEPALPGMSTHNYAEGVDFTCDPNYSASYIRVGQIAKEEDLRYGGDFVDLEWKPTPDFVHIDNMYKFTNFDIYSLREGLKRMKAQFDESKLVEI